MGKVGLRKDLKGITFTMIFEASALNRDEKIGGNIPSIKKLTRYGTVTVSYLSREAMRHYLFHTLNKRYPHDWEPAPTFESGAGNNKVVQFDLRRANIITHAELDAFGYMFTIGGQTSITRKAPVGITKAVALEPWEGDMQFNANHDIASRCRANPNPVNKEEQESYFKVTFTIDVDKLGQDEWWIKDYNYDNTTKTLSLFLSEKGSDIILKDVEKAEDEPVYKIGEHEIKIEGLSCIVSMDLMEEKSEKSKNREEKRYITFKKKYIVKKEKKEEEEKTGKKEKSSKPSFKIYEEEFELDEEENIYRFTIGKYSYDSDKKHLTLSLVLTHSIKADKVNEEEEKYKVKCTNIGECEITIKTEDSGKKTIFRVNDKIKVKRLQQIFEILKNGIIYHSSGENYGIIPEFIIAAGLEIPVPVFHPFVELGRIYPEALNNCYILGDGNDKKLIYIQDIKNKFEGKPPKDKYYTDWKEFLEALGFSE